jgi:hypothetical protein
MPPKKNLDTDLLVWNGKYRNCQRSQTSLEETQRVDLESIYFGS